MLELLPKVPLGTHIWANPEMNIETCLLHQLNKFYQIIVSFKIELPEGQKTNTFSRNSQSNKIYE